MSDMNYGRTAYWNTDEHGILKRERRRWGNGYQVMGQTIIAFCVFCRLLPCFESTHGFNETKVGSVMSSRGVIITMRKRM